MSDVTHPRLPARPLVDLVESGRAEASARLLWAWRQPGAKVQWQIADRVLTPTSFLWFDVWEPCEAHAGHEAGCEACEAHALARLAFTGEGRRERGRPGRPRKAAA